MGHVFPLDCQQFFLLRLGVIQSTTTVSYSNTVRHLRTTVIETSSFSRISQKAIVFVARRVCVLCYFICASRLISMFFVLFLPPNPGDAAEKSRIRRRKSRRSREYRRLPCFSAFAAIWLIFGPHSINAACCYRRRMLRGLYMHVRVHWAHRWRLQNGWTDRDAGLACDQWTIYTVPLLFSGLRNESVPIQLAQCRFPRLAISNANILLK